MLKKKNIPSKIPCPPKSNMTELKKELRSDRVLYTTGVWEG